MDFCANSCYNGDMGEKTKERGLLFEGGLNYSLSAVFPVVLSLVFLVVMRAALGSGYAESDVYKYLSFVVPQVCIAAAAILFFRRTGRKASFVYRCPARWQYIPVAVVLAFGLFSLSELNELFFAFLEDMGYHSPAVELPDVSGWLLVPALLVIALLPAFFEETFFRGIQVRVMRESGWGVFSAALITGALFSLYHGNPAQTIYQFLCGVCYGLLAAKSGSVFPSMLAHFLNNAVIVILLSAGVEQLVPAGAELPFYLVSGVALAAALAVLTFADRKESPAFGAKGGKSYFLAAGAGIAVCAVEWIAVCAEGFI